MTCSDFQHIVFGPFVVVVSDFCRVPSDYESVVVVSVVWSVVLVFVIDFVVVFVFVAQWKQLGTLVANKDPVCWFGRWQVE